MQYEHPGNILFSGIFMFFWYDFFSGLLHIVLDNPDFIPFPLLGTPCLEFQWHHHIPLDLASKHFLETCGDLNTVATILGTLFFTFIDKSSIICCLACFKLLFAYFGQFCHCMAHTPAHRRPAWVETLQNSGIMVSPLEHGVHHKTYDDNFCIGSGICNPLITWCTKNLPANKYFWLVSFLLCAVADVPFFDYILRNYFGFV
jgi:palmitoyl-[glycerolipid] 3-(E)-desaturase